MAEETSSDCEDNEIRVVLVGKTGVGKSATANLLCNEENFFLSRSGSSAVTETCKHKKVQLDDKNVLVVDTPGLFDSQRVEEETKLEIKKCIDMCAPSIHAILYVVSLSLRLTPEDIDTFNSFVTFFGEDMYKYTIVIFTNPDKLSKEGQTLENYIVDSPKLDAFVKKCSNRKLAIDNNASKLFADQQRRTILKYIELMMHTNDGKGYTNKDFTEAGKKLIQKTLKRYENEYKKKLDKAKEDYKIQIRKELDKEYRNEMKRLKEQNKKLEKQVKDLETKFKEQSLDDAREEISMTTGSKLW
ncbi:Hypothetical predicted protein [Mytilus galloprovincialis]|uniref:AIG1-type G domain-containing protein n=1 Tax=Mytilus galloprovincialis TaxID=29158 RepID=A0A8B6H0Q7_MYTGA|nr:Hypothetical predicted protein [Mytilus galloprovincialis]